MFWVATGHFNFKRMARSNGETQTKQVCKTAIGLASGLEKKNVGRVSKSITIGLADISKIYAYAVKRLFNSTLDKLSPTESSYANNRRHGHSPMQRHSGPKIKPSASLKMGRRRIELEGQVAILRPAARR